jgi:hypothetical protein
MGPRILVGWKIARVQNEKAAVADSLKEASAYATQDTLETKTEFAIEKTMADCKIKVKGFMI